MEIRSTFIRRLMGIQKDVNLLEAEQRLKTEIARLNKRVDIPIYFKNENVDFEINKEFTELINEIVVGKAYARLHLNLPNVKCIHSKWAKGTYMKVHKHVHLDEYLWVTNGCLLIVEYDEKTKAIVNEVNIDTNDQFQPYIIKKNTPHFVKAVEKHTNFIVKFKK